MEGEQLGDMWAVYPDWTGNAAKGFIARHANHSTTETPADQDDQEEDEKEKDEDEDNRGR